MFRKSREVVQEGQAMLGCFQLGKHGYLNGKNSLTKSRGRVDSSRSTVLLRTWFLFLAFHAKIGSPYG